MEKNENWVMDPFKRWFQANVTKKVVILLFCSVQNLFLLVIWYVDEWWTTSFLPFLKKWSDMCSPDSFKPCFRLNCGRKNKNKINSNSMKDYSCTPLHTNFKMQIIKFRPATTLYKVYSECEQSEYELKQTSTSTS